MNCLNCAIEITQVSDRRPRQYCSDSCRQKKWQRDKKANAACSDTINPIPVACGPLPSIETMEVKPPPGLKGIDLTIWKAEQKEKNKTNGK